MRIHPLSFVVSLALSAAVIPSTTSCTPQARAAVVEILDDAAKACIWANADLPIPAIKPICMLTEYVDDVVKIVLDDFFAHQGTLRAFVARYEVAHHEGKPFPSLSAERP